MTNFLISFKDYIYYYIYITDENKNLVNIIPFSSINTVVSKPLSISSTSKVSSNTHKSLSTVSSSSNKSFKSTRNTKSNITKPTQVIKLKRVVIHSIKKNISNPKPTQKNEHSLVSNDISSVPIESEKLTSSKRNFDEFKSASAPAPGIVRSTKRLTIPKTPIKSLTQRLGKKTCSIHGATSVVETETNETVRETTGPTKFQPFSFETDKRAKIRGSDIAQSSGDHNEFIPAKEIERMFMNDARSHEVPRNVTKSLTEPKSPELLTTKRAKFSSNFIKSHDELEDEQMKEFEKHPFKAKPILKPKFRSSNIPLRPVTEPQPFALRIDKRSSLRSSSVSAAITDCDSSFVFKALPLPETTSIPIAVSPRPVESQKPLTKPMSPKLHGNLFIITANPCRQLPQYLLTNIHRKSSSISCSITSSETSS